MTRRQPDTRVHPHELGMMIMGDQRFVINLRRGAPFNACIEESKESLRCWASLNFLDRRAAAAVDGNATKTGGNAFVWNEDVKQGVVACTKGDPPHTLYKVVLPK